MTHRALRTVLALLLTGALAACGGGSGSDQGGLEGTFVLKDGTQSIRFHPEGRFVLNVAGTYAGEGTYRVEGERVLLDWPGDGTRQGRVEGDRFVDWRGRAWER